MAGSKKEYELAVKIAGMVDASLASSCALTKRQLKEIAKEAAAANATTVSYSQAMKAATPGIDGAWNGLKTTVGVAVKAMEAAGAAVVGIGAASVGVGKEFEGAMSSWAATANASTEDYKKARDAAMEMGRTTSKTATESAAALEYMALAGWSVDDSISGLPGVLRLSEATGLDLARTSDLVTDSMSALGVEVQDLPGYLDIAAKANNKSNQTAEQLMEAYIGVGGVMKNLKVPTAESATALGVLANRGIKGSEAGNALNAVMINLTTGTGQAGKMMGKLGISAFDNEGKFKGLKATLEEVNKATSGLTEEEQNAALAAIGGKMHVDALNDLMSGLNTTLEDGSSEWDSLNDSLNHANGSLEQMANTKLDNLNGDVAIFQSALQDAGIQIYDSLQEPLRDVVQFGTEKVYEFSDNISDAVGKKMPTIKRQLGEAKDAIAGFSEPFLEVGGWMLDHPDVIAGGLAAIGTTITTMKVAQTLNTTATAVKALGVAMASNPVLAAVGMAALAGGAVVGMTTQMKIADEKLKQQNLKDHFGDITLSMNELERMATQVIDNGNLEKIGTTMEQFDKVGDIAKKLEDSQDTMSKLNWKVNMGLNLNEGESEAYGAAISKYVEDSISMAEQQQYAMNLSLDLLIGEGEEGEGIKTKFNEFYEKLNGELRDLGDQLGEAYSEGMKDGVLSMDEVETIQKLQGKMADITSKLSTSKFEAKMENLKMKYESGGKLDPDAFQNLQTEIQAQMDKASESLGESLEMNIQGAKLMLDSGDFNQSEYENAIKTFEENYRTQIGDMQAKAGSFMTETITNNYAEEISAAVPQITGAIDSAMETAFADMENSDASGRLKTEYATSLSGIFDDAIGAVGSEGLSEGSRLAIEQLLENMTPSIQQMEAVKKKYEEAGEKAPEGVAEGLAKVEMLQLITGNADAIWNYTGQKIEGSPQYTVTYNRVKEVGGTLPKQIGDGIDAKKSDINAGIDAVYKQVQEYANQKFANPINVNAKINVKSSDNISGNGGVGHASGGIFDQPHYGVFAEAGPEAFIPIDRSKRSLSIWQQAGEMLGMGGGTSNSDNSQKQITYSPVYQIYGADEGTVRSATRDDQDRFEQMMNRYLRDQVRLSF